MTYLALLRGINVGGNNKVDMKSLKATFERLGFHAVKTYINTGNIIFQTTQTPTLQLATQIEKAIAQDFELSVATLVVAAHTLKQVAQAIPSHWVNDSTMKCDVLFLWSAVDSPQILKQLTIKEQIDEVKYVPGAVIWRVDRDKVTRSGLLKIVGTKLYKQITVRNCNTARKLATLLDDPAS